MATCEDVTITIRNETSVEIRATKFEYTYGGKGITEHIFGVDGSDRFDPGDSKEYGRRNFGSIGNETTTFTVTYQRRRGSGWGATWGANLVHTHGPVHCDDNDSFTITLTD